MRILREDAVAVVIDFQEKLVPLMHEREALLKNAGVLIRGFHTLGVPILVTQQYTKGLGATVPEIREALGLFEPVEKLAFSCHDEPAFRKKFDAAGKSHVLVCGIEAHVCVLQTVLDLKAAGFRPVLVEDCVSSRHANDKRVAVERAVASGAIITTCESVLFELLRRAGTPELKAISNLVKATVGARPAMGEAARSGQGEGVAETRIGVCLDFEAGPPPKATGEAKGPDTRAAAERPGIGLSFDLGPPPKAPATDGEKRKPGERKGDDAPRRPKP